MGIKGYHTCAFPGRTGGALAIPEKSPLVGIEFETEIKSRDSLITRVEAAFAGKEVQFYPETDGSLTGHSGVEFVSSPMTVGAIASKKGPLATLLGIISDNETAKTSSRIGMHVNVSALSEQHAVATAAFGNLLADVSRRVGGRGDVYSNHETENVYNRSNEYYKGKAVAVRNRPVPLPAYTCPTTGATLPNTGSTMEWRNEFRGHRSTTDITRARMQIRYSVLVSEFARLNMDQLAPFVGKKQLVQAFRSELEKAFIAFVEKKVGKSKRSTITSKLLELMKDPSKCIWHYGKNDLNMSPQERASIMSVVLSAARRPTPAMPDDRALAA